FRSLRRTPGFSAVAILTLALGIGASTVVFSFVNGVLLKPLNYPDGERLVTISPVFRGQSITVTPGDFLEWQAQSQSFSEITAFTVVPNNLTVAGEASAVQVAMVTPRFAETIGVPPVLGHTFADRGAPEGLGVMISNRLWRERF